MDRPDLSPSSHDPLGVLVGFDGSRHATAALHWGAAAAQRRGTTLSVVAAFTAPMLITGHVDAAGGSVGVDAARRATEQVLQLARDTLDGAGFTSESLPTRFFTVNEDATGALARLSENADLIVIGRRGHGRFWSRVLGSVSAALPAHAQCPTVIVGASDEDVEDITRVTEDTRPVTVGVDTSPTSRKAALVAADEAIAAGVPLRAVLVLPSFTGPPSTYTDAAAHLETQSKDAAQRGLDAELNWIREQRPEVELQGTIMRGIPAEAMIEASGSSQLTVLGSRGRGGFTSLLLGSVSRTTLSNAKGTIMVVPKDRKR